MTIHLINIASDVSFHLLFKENHLHLASAKGECALRGYFDPPVRPKYENCLSQVSSY